jgi:hypothetical protein
MTDPMTPKEPEQKKSWFGSGKDKAKITANRVLLWVLVGGFGLYLIITGVVGILTKSR